MTVSTRQIFSGIVLAMAVLFTLNITAHAMEPKSDKMMENDGKSMMHGDQNMTPDEMIEKGEQMIEEGMVEEGKSMKMKGEQMKEQMMMEKDRM